MAIGTVSGATSAPAKVKTSTPNPAGAQAKTPTGTTGTATPPTDKTTVSSEAGDLKNDPRAQKVTAGLGDSFGAAAVKTDTWKKGPNDTIEGMLKGKGFSLKDIYTKGPNGQNMVDRVMSANKIKDARKMKDGMEVVIPDMGKNGSGTATSGLKPGEKTEAKNVGDHKIQSEKLADGTNQSSVDTTNGTKVKVQSPGDSTNASQVAADGSTSTQTLAKNAQGQVTTEVNSTTRGKTDTIEARALDGGKVKGTVSPDGANLANGEVKVPVQFDERKNDGFLENLGHKVDGMLGNAPGPARGVEVEGKSVTTSATGNDVQVAADGKQVARLNQDADDGFFERTGTLAGKAVDKATDLAQRAGTAVRDTASGFWNWMTGAN